MATSPRQGPFVETAEDENVLSPGDAFRIIRNRGWVIVLAIIVAVGIAVGYSLLQTPQYEASVRILVGQASGIVDNPGNAQGLRDLTQTMAQAVSTRSVAEETIRQLNLSITPEKFLANLSANPVSNTQFVKVNYRDTDPERAQSVANTVGDVFSRQISAVSPDASSVTATVWERATVPAAPVSPNTSRNAALALLIGAIVGAGLAFLLEYLDDSWRSPEEAEQVSGVPTFGVIPRFEMPGDKKKAKVRKKIKDDEVKY